VSASRLPAADGRYAEIFEVDDVIDPADTRFWLVRSLEACPPVKG
jgi:acetyl-CoA carboxylase carboxyltransferase component